MRALLIAATAATLLAAPAIAQTSPAISQDKGELGYPAGSLGYDALMAGKVDEAELQLRTSQIDRNDPARLINLGQVYARKGRIAEAESMFAQAMSVEEIELVLASGRVIGSREAARLALRAMKSDVAARR